VALAALLSFPTRRSSDLGRKFAAPVFEAVEQCLAIAVARMLVAQACDVGEISIEAQLGEAAAGRQAAVTVLVPACVFGGVEGLRSEEHTSELQSRENLVC